MKHKHRKGYSMTRFKKILIICFALLVSVSCLGIIIAHLIPSVDSQSKTSTADSIVPKFRPTVDTSNLEYVRSFDRPIDAYDLVINATDVDLVDRIDVYCDSAGVEYQIQRDTQTLRFINFLKSEQAIPTDASLASLQEIAADYLTEIGFSLDDYTLVFAEESSYGDREFLWQENEVSGIRSSLRVCFTSQGTLSFISLNTSGFSAISEVDQNRCHKLFNKHFVLKENQEITSLEISYYKLCGKTLAYVEIVVSQYEKNSERLLFDDPQIILIYY